MAPAATPPAADEPSQGAAGATDRSFARACVVGLGVVGIPVAAQLAKTGIKTIGLDRDVARVAAIQQGRYPFASDEPGMDELLAQVHENGSLSATTDPAEALQGADAIIVVVQTPFDEEARAPRYDALQGALGDVAKHLARGALVVVESTIAPGTMRDIVQPTLESGSGLKAGRDFFVGHCPERVMPGKLLHNIVNYERVVGGLDAASTERMMSLYRHFVKGSLLPADMTTAEVVKTTENAYRDVEIAFANEVAKICEPLGVDTWRVRELVNRVEGRNMHMPGIGVGGHCIPKDGLLLAHAASRAEDAALLHTARRVNEGMPEHTLDLVTAAIDAVVPDDDDAAAASERAHASLARKTIVVLGVAYLPGSDDTRHTPTAPFAELARARGATIRLVDPYVDDLDGEPVHKDVVEALQDAHVVVLSTTHEPYTAPDWERWRSIMASPIAIDGRGAWSADAARQAGFHYRGVGR